MVSQREQLASKASPPENATEQETRIPIGLREPVTWFALLISATALVGLLYATSRLVGKLLLAATGLVGSL